MEQYVEWWYKSCTIDIPINMLYDVINILYEIKFVSLIQLSILFYTKKSK